MRVAITLLLALAISLATAQQLEITQVIDGWGDSARPLILILEDSAPPAVSASEAVLSDAVLGGERDVQIIAEGGSLSSVTFTQFAPEGLTFAAPAEMQGRLVVQYDGRDGSIDLSPSGLGGVDLTRDSGDRFHLRMECDVGAIMEITVYSARGGRSTGTVNVVARNDPRDYDLRFLQMIGDADMSAVGAIEVTVPFNDNLDLVISEFDIRRPAGAAPVPVPPTVSSISRSFTPLSPSPSSFSPVSTSPLSPESPTSVSPISVSTISESPVTFSVSPVSDSPSSLPPVPTLSPLSESPLAPASPLAPLSPVSPTSQSTSRSFSPLTFSRSTSPSTSSSSSSSSTTSSPDSVSPVSVSPISPVSPVSPVNPQRPPRLEFVEPVGEKMIDFNLGCVRRVELSSESSSSSSASALTASLLFLAVVILF